jgi:hypothetical protein
VNISNYSYLDHNLLLVNSDFCSGFSFGNPGFNWTPGFPVYFSTLLPAEFRINALKWARDTYFQFVFHLTFLKFSLITSPLFDDSRSWWRQWPKRPNFVLKGKSKVVPVLFLTEHRFMKAYWGSGNIAPRILDLGTRWRWVVSYMSRPLYPQG